jgi:hypothetical protein
MEDEEMMFEYPGLFNPIFCWCHANVGQLIVMDHRWVGRTMLSLQLASIVDIASLHSQFLLVAHATLLVLIASMIPRADTDFLELVPETQMTVPTHSFNATQPQVVVMDQHVQRQEHGT